MLTEAMGEVEKTVKWHSSLPVLSIAYLQPNMYTQASEQMFTSVVFFMCKRGCFYFTQSISSQFPTPHMLGALCFSTWTSTSETHINIAAL